MEKIPVVLSCVGLLHDLGNPPFGHFGEVAIGEWLQNWMDYVRGWFMYCVAYGFSSNYENIMEGTFYQELMEGTFHEKSVQIFKGAMAKFVYGIAEIVKLELSAKKIISSLLDDFIDAVIYDREDENHKLTKAQKKLWTLFRTTWSQITEMQKQERKGMIYICFPQ